MAFCLAGLTLPLLFTCSAILLGPHVHPLVVRTLDLISTIFPVDLLVDPCFGSLQTFCMCPAILQLENISFAAGQPRRSLGPSGCEFSQHNP